MRYHDIALADNTYKTNRFKMPLLHIIGITPLDTHFSAAFCFLSSETEEDFTWAMKQFRDVMDDKTVPFWLTDCQLALKNGISMAYPGTKQMLCLWHINKNVKVKVQQYWPLPYNPTKIEEVEAT
jgi:hypothetical protein